MTTRSTLAHCAARARPAGGPRRGRLRLLRRRRRRRQATPTTRRALAGSPAPLAALHAQANELLPGGTDAYEKRIAALRGLPGRRQRLGLLVRALPLRVPGPAEALGPLRQAGRLPRRRLRGLRRRRRDLPRRGAGPLPELHRPRQGDRRLARRPRGLPDTAFYDRAGELVYLKQGPYADDADSKPTFARYALKRRIIERWKPSSSSPWSASPCCSPSCCCRPAACSRRVGAAGLVAGGIVALDSDSERRRLHRPGADHARHPLGDHLLLRHPQGHRGPPRPAGADRHRGADRRRAPRRARRSTPTGQVWTAGDALGRAAGGRRGPGAAGG